MERQSIEWNYDYKAPNVHVLDRGIQVLEATLEGGPEATLAEVAARTKLPKSTVHRLLAAWVRHGYVAMVGLGRYAVGPQVLATAALISDSQDVARIARPYLLQLHQQTDHTIHLGLLVGNEAIYVDKIEGNRPYRMSSAIGLRLPLHATAIGKAILAHDPHIERDLSIVTTALVEKTARTITTPSALRRELAATHARGWSLDDEENEVGIRCVAAPIFSYRRDVIGAISISAPAFDLTVAGAEEVAPTLIAAADAVTNALGGSRSRLANPSSRVTRPRPTGRQGKGQAGSSLRNASARGKTPQRATPRD